jgi:2-dehydro-3-deoxyphosphogluconate aldolase/(4S)-4-hydroxy-2-oxoglutarate aldolase
MDKHSIVNYLLEHGIIAIIRAENSEGLVRVVEAVAAGGVHCIEVTMTTPGALQCIADASKALQETKVCLGVGSVLDAETARLAILAGAQYVVSPITSEPVIRMAHRYGKPALPGAYTPTEIFHAWELGADIVKVFPATHGGLEYLKAVRAPMPQIPLCPTGGVSVENLKDWVAAGVSAVGVGTNLVQPKLVQAQDYAGITATAQRFSEAWKALRG